MIGVLHQGNWKADPAKCHMMEICPASGECSQFSGDPGKICLIGWSISQKVARRTLHHQQFAVVAVKQGDDCLECLLIDWREDRGVEAA